MKGPDGKYAWTATVGEKGQIVIPKQAREVFGIEPGDVLMLLGDEQRGIAILPKEQVAQLHQMTFGGAGQGMPPFGVPGQPFGGAVPPFQGTEPPFGGTEE